MKRIYLQFLITMLMTAIAGCPGSGANNSIAVKPLLPDAIEIAGQSLTSPDGVIRANAAEVVANAGRKDMARLVVNLLNDNAPAVRFAAAAALGDLAYTPAAPALKKLLQDPNPNVKIAVAYALTKMGASGYSDLIRKSLSSDDQTVRANAALLLGKLGNKNDTELLWRALRDENSFDKVKLQAIESIAALGDERIYKAKLWALLISQRADDRVIGIRGMGALGTFDAQNAIITMLDDDVLEVRLCAAEQLGTLGDRSGADEVYNYFISSPNINESSLAAGLAASAVGKIKDPRLNAFLPALLKSSSPVVRLNAAQSVLLLNK